MWQPDFGDPAALPCLVDHRGLVSAHRCHRAAAFACPVAVRQMGIAARPLLTSGPAPCRQSGVCRDRHRPSARRQSDSEVIPAADPA